MPGVCEHNTATTEHTITLFIGDRMLGAVGQMQVVPYLIALADTGLRVTLVSFETKADLGDTNATDRLRARLERKRIEWTPIQRRRHPWANVATGVATAIRVARREHIGIVHARGFVPGLIGWSLKPLLGARFLFDMRRFSPEASVELGKFRPQGFSYRASKRLEQFLIAESDHLVVPTESAKAILRQREAEARMAARRFRETPITVIPGYADLTRFAHTPSGSRPAELEGNVVIGNCGAIDKRYMLAEMFRFAFHLKSHRPNVRFVYLTGDDESPIRGAARNAGLGDADLLVRSVDPDEVPRWLSSFRLGVFFLAPSYTAKASSFTELAEFLASGIPVVTNTGVGDVDQILASPRCGILVSGLTDGALAAAARQALEFLEDGSRQEEVRARCRGVAEAHFSLEMAKTRYRRIYEHLEISGATRDETPAAAELG